MKRLIFFSVFCFAVLHGGLASAGIYADSQVVCRVNYSADADQIAGSIGAYVDGSIEGASTYLFRYSSLLPVDSAVASLERMGDVIYAHPNYMLSIFDPLQVSQPFVDITSEEYVEDLSPALYYNQYSCANLMLDSAHHIATGDGTVVAVIDGALNITHPLFSSGIDPASHDFINNTSEPWGLGGIINDHCTFISGVVRLTAPDAQLMILRCFSNGGRSTGFEISQAVYYAADHDADVINMSFGSYQYDQTVSEAIEYAYDKGIIMVAAAGNGNEESSRFPGSHSKVINVAAVDSTDHKTDFSNFGLDITLTAPGAGIYGPLTDGDSWGWWQGTSFASSFVSGQAALVKHMYQDYDAAGLIQVIKSNAESIDDINPEYAGDLGAGRINVLYSVYLDGDANYDTKVNLGDVIYVINYVFKDGPSPIPPEAGDANCDGNLDVGDAVYMIKYIFGQNPSIGCR